MSTLVDTGDFGTSTSAGLESRQIPLEGGSKRRGPPDSRSARATNSSVPSNQPQNSTGPWLSRPCDPITAQPSFPKQVASSHELHPTRCAVAAVNAYKLKSPASTKRLSFSDEMDEEDGGGSTFSLAESTRKRFQTERRANLSHQLQALAAQPQTTSLPKRLGKPSEQTLGPIICGAAQARGLRPYMEDRQTFISCFTPLTFKSQPIPDDILRTFAAVYDGHNGAMAAEYASYRLHKLLAQDPALRWKESSASSLLGATSLDAQDREAKACACVDQAIRKAFFTVDREILDKSRDENGRDGSTALVVLRMGNVLWTAHAGDSRAVLCRDGRAMRLTEDHKPELEREKARIEANGGQVDFQRCWRVICPAQENRKASGLAVSRSLGDLDFKEPLRYVECEPDIGRLRATPEDSFVVMASDGLWDVIKDEEAVTIVQEKLAATAARGQTQAALDARTKKASQLLLDTALNKGSMDNITVLVLLFQWH